MKKFIPVLAVTSAAVILSACATTHHPVEKPIGIANPASVYCVNQGGKSIIRKDATGAEAGYCQLPNGQVVDEWALYRQAQHQ